MRIDFKPFGLGPKQSKDFAIPVPQGAANIAFNLTGKCHCGGELLPHPKKPLVWICNRSHWWNRKKHAYLRGSLQPLPASQGEA